MILKLYKPKTPTLRFLKTINYQFLLKIQKLKKFSKKIKRTFGHNNQGRYTSYHKGGGHKKIYRFLNNNLEFQGIIEGIEYDPYRTSFILRVYNLITKTNFYQLASDNLKRGDLIQTNLTSFKPKLGYSSILKLIPVGAILHNLQFFYKSKSRVAVAAGTYVQLIQKFPKQCLLKLCSGEFKFFSLNCIATFGRTSNLEHKLKSYGKAGRTRWLNKRPTVRGVAMNPIDHPHGGGQGKTAAGRPSCTPWGKLTKGVKTVKKKKIFLFNLNKK